MGGTAFSNNTTIKIKGKVTSGYTVQAGEWVRATFDGYMTSAGFSVPMSHIDYAPGDTVAASVTYGGITLNLITALCYINSP